MVKIMSEIYAVRKSNCFIPVNDSDLENLKRVKNGEMVKVEIKKPRNIKFHRKFFALLQIVVDNDERYANTNVVLHIMKLKLGHYESIVNTNGKMIYIPKSISFTKMDDTSFGEFYQQAVNKVLSDFLPEWNEEVLEQAVETIIRF